MTLPSILRTVPCKGYWNAVLHPWLRIQQRIHLSAFIYATINFSCVMTLTSLLGLPGTLKVCRPFAPVQSKDLGLMGSSNYTAPLKVLGGIPCSKYTWGYEDHPAEVLEGFQQSPCPQGRWQTLQDLICRILPKTVTKSRLTCLNFLLRLVIPSSWYEPFSVDKEEGPY